jgi:glycosyltransferase involved in cell wall biosynthesis
LLVDPSSPDSIADALRFYADNPEILERHGANARLAAEGELNWQTQEVLLIEAYQHLIPTPSHD